MHTMNTKLDQPTVIPQKIPEAEQQVVLLIAKEGKIIDLRVVGDGFLGRVLKESTKLKPKIVESCGLHKLATSPGYVTYQLIGNYVKSFEALRVGMNLVTEEEYHELHAILENLGEFAGTAEDPMGSEMVQFYGCF